ncbi:MAG: hypothetical protein IT383_05835 [Deltaproteobacteria bacterium]|nr:hypothetical protein [Deltaproteobacteria bacterium]
MFAGARAWLTGAAMVSLAFACGRSAPQDDFCRAREGLSCATMASERAAEQAEYRAAVEVNDVALMQLRGACVQDFVSEQLEDGCIALEAASLCTELCGLHPCDVREADGTVSATASCPTRCVDEQGENGIDATALQNALTRAAGTPGLCTCQVCDIASDALCKQLWNCD